MDQRFPARQKIVLAGAGGDLGARIAKALVARGADTYALLRPGTAAAKQNALSLLGVKPVLIDYNNAVALQEACAGAACVVSVLNGLAPVIIDAQSRLLDAAVEAGVPRFIPSDFCLDFTKTRPGDNRNMDLRRAFGKRVDTSPIRTTSVLNGAFAELLTGGAPILLNGPRKVLYWGSADQSFDFTTKDDVARYTAMVALDDAAPRFLRIAGDVATPRSLAAIASSVKGKTFGLWRAGGINLISTFIWTLRALTPRSNAPFPAWQGMQYLRDMSSGRGKLEPLDNDRYGNLSWKTVTEVLQQA